MKGQVVKFPGMRIVAKPDPSFDIIDKADEIAFRYVRGLSKRRALRREIAALVAAELAKQGQN